MLPVPQQVTSYTNSLCHPLRELTCRPCNPCAPVFPAHQSAAWRNLPTQWLFVSIAYTLPQVFVAGDEQRNSVGSCKHMIILPVMPWMPWLPAGPVPPACPVAALSTITNTATAG